MKEQKKMKFVYLEKQQKEQNKWTTWWNKIWKFRANKRSKKQQNIINR